jgi:hypothetical protein
MNKETGRERKKNRKVRSIVRKKRKKRVRTETKKVEGKGDKTKERIEHK